MNCPELISASSENFAILYKWIPGEVSGNTDSAKKFIFNTINQLSKNSALIDNYDLNAIDAVLKPLDLLQQLNERFASISSISKIPIDLMYSIDSELDLVSGGLDSSFAYESKLLSLSDFGTHNLIQTNLNDFMHIDFEFFGIDSTAKLYADL